MNSLSAKYSSLKRRDYLNFSFEKFQKPMEPWTAPIFVSFVLLQKKATLGGIFNFFLFFKITTECQFYYSLKSYTYHDFVLLYLIFSKIRTAQSRRCPSVGRENFCKPRREILRKRYRFFFVSQHRKKF